MRNADGQQVMAHNDNVQVTVNYQNNRLPAGQPITISYSNPSQWTVVDWEDGVSKQLGNDLTATNNGHGTFTVKSNMDKDLDINFALHFALQYAGDVESNTLTPLVITTKRGNATVNTKTVKPIIIPYKDHVVADEIAHGWAAKDVHKVKTNFDNTHDILSGTKATTGKEADNREVMQYMIEWNYGKVGNTKGTTLSPLQTADFTAYLSKGQTMLPDTIKVFRVYQPNAVDGNGQRVSIDKSYSKITDCVNGVFVNEDPAFEQFLKDHLTVTVNNSTTQLSWRDYQTALQKAKHDRTEPPLVNGIHLKESDMAHVKLSTDANGQSHNFSVNSGDNEDSTVKSPHSTFFIQFDTLLDYNMPVSWTTPGDGPSISYNRASGKFGGVGTQIDKSTSKVFQGGGNGFTHQIAYEATLHFADITDTDNVTSLDRGHGVSSLNGDGEENASGSTEITFAGQSGAIKTLEKAGYQLVGVSKRTLISGKYNGSDLYDGTGAISNVKYGTYGEGTKERDGYTYTTSFTLQFVVRTAKLQPVSKTATRTVYYKEANADQPDQTKLVDLAKKVNQSVSFSGSQYQDAQGNPVAVITLKDFKEAHKLHVNKEDDKVYLVNPSAAPTAVKWQPKAGEKSILNKATSTVSFDDENQQAIKDKNGNTWYITPATKNLGKEETVPSTTADKHHTDVYLIYDHGQRALLRYYDDDAQVFLDNLAKPINTVGQTGDAITFENDQQELDDLLNKHYIYAGISKTDEKHPEDGAELGQYEFGNFDDIKDQQVVPSQAFVIHVKHAKTVVTNYSREQRVIKYFDAQTNEELNKKTKLANEVVQLVSWTQTAIVDQVMNNKVVGYNLTGKKDANNNLVVETKDPAKSWFVTSKASDYPAVKSPDLAFLGYEELPSFSRKSNQQDAALVVEKSAQPNVSGGEVDVYYFHVNVNADITYWDITNGMSNKVKLAFDQDTDQHGQPGQIIHLPKDRTPSFVNQGYLFVSTDYKLNDRYGKSNSHFNVYLVHQKIHKENTVTEQRVIRYFDAQTGQDLSQKTALAKEVTQPVSWKQTQIIDKVNGKILGYNTTGHKDKNGQLTVDTTDATKSWLPLTSNYPAVPSPDLTGFGYEKVPSFNRQHNKQDAAVVEKETAQLNVPGGEVDVYYFHAHAPQSRTVKVNEVIHYRYKDTGKTAAPDFVAKPLSFTQTGYKDMVNNVVVWNGQWSPAQEFKAVTSPKINGYTPDKSVIQAQRVDHNSPDLEFLVLYSKKAQPTKPTEPTQPTQPTKPTVPTQPTQPTVPTSPTKPTQPTRPTQPTNPVQPTQLTAPTEPQTPKQPNRQLPQTGRKGNMGIVAAVLAAMFAGSLGLGFKKCRN